MDISTTAESAKPIAPVPGNEAHIKFCEVAKEIGIPDEIIDLIKKHFKMTDDETPEKPEVKPEEKVAPTEEKVSPMMAMIADMMKKK